MRLMPLLLAAAVFGGSGAAQAAKWDMPTPYPDGNFHTQNIRQFADEVKAATGGKVEIVVHSNGALIKHPEIKRAVQTGQVPLGEVLISSLSNEDPIYGIDSVPFLATDYAAARKLYDASKSVLEQRLDKQGLKLLFSVPWPPQGLYTKTEAKSLAELKGVKFRAYNPATSRIAELGGMVPTKVEAAEVPQAFATGVVQAMITSAATGVDTKAWEYTKFYYDTQAWLPRNMVIISKDALAGLDETTRKALLDVAAKAEKRGWETSQAKNGELKETLSKNGISVQPPPAQLKQDFDAIGKTMTADWIKQAGADGEAVIAKFRQ